MGSGSRALGVPLLLACLTVACSQDEPSLSDFLPPLPKPDGTPQRVWAGPITAANAGKLISGPAQTGRVGDVFVRNGRARFVIQSTTRVIGIVPWGGNLVDAVPIGPDGRDLAEDHLGEVSPVYMLGRTCAHERLEVVLDGSGGGPAVVRATGLSAVNDYINIPGIGVLTPDEISPDIPDRLECAATYTLRPGSDTLEVAWTFFNPAGEDTVRGPLGALNDTGGEVQVFAPRVGFSHLQGDLSRVLEQTPTRVQYNVYQGPGVAYGIVPRLADPAQGVAGFVVAGAAVLIFGAEQFLDVNVREKDHLVLDGGRGMTVRLDVVVGRDGADVEAAFQRGRGGALGIVEGTVVYAPAGRPAVGARVGAYEDANDDGAVGAGDPILTYFDVDADGKFGGELPHGDWLLRADAPDVARSAAVTVSVGAAPATIAPIALAEPARVDFTVVDADDASSPPIPVKITVIGRHPVALEASFHQTQERRFGVVTKRWVVSGTSTGAGVDEPLLLPAGGPYRIHFSRGPEWSTASVVVTLGAGEQKTLPVVGLERVVDTAGYVATAFHEHSLASPDSPVSLPDRVRTLVTEGIEFFASTDHDRLTDYDPVIDDLGLRGMIDAVVGEEATPFALGHFIGFPLAYDPSDPAGGAPDWGDLRIKNRSFFPSEIWQLLRGNGAQIVQVNHPRSFGLGAFQAYFTRAGLTFDFAARTITGDPALQDVSNADLRLPFGQTLYANEWDVLETWIGFGTTDSDGDGAREYGNLDVVLRDWMNFLSLGKLVTPVANGDTHTKERDAAGLPRTLVRVADDTAGGLLAGVDADVYATLLGTTARDVVVTNGPMISVLTTTGAPAIGRVVPATDGEVTLTVHAQAADWAEFDTLEIFANETFDPLLRGDPTHLVPLICFTIDPDALPASSACKQARLGARSWVVTTTALVGVQATATVTLAPADVSTRAGHTGDDAWVVARVRGRRALYPVVLDDVVTDSNVDTLVAGDPAEVAAVLRDRGAPAMAFTGPILVDFDGGGWRAPFAP